MTNESELKNQDNYPIVSNFVICPTTIVSKLKFLFITRCLILCLGSGVLLTCSKKENPDPNAKTNPSVAVLDSLSKKRSKVKLYKLAKGAQNELGLNQDFKELKSLIRLLHKSNPFYIQKYADSIHILIQNLNDDYTYKNDHKNNIASRLTVLRTVSGVLSFDANKSKPNPDSLLLTNKKLIEAYNSLVIQLNELSLDIPALIEKELFLDKDADLQSPQP